MLDRLPSARMSDTPRIEDLRRRVQKDPASIAFAQLAEEYRRTGLWQEAIDVCRDGLALHPGYISARVTLGRALLQKGELEPAVEELEHVLRVAPDHLAARRAIAAAHHKRGNLTLALVDYQKALALAPNDPELERSVLELAERLAQQQAEPHRVRATKLLAALEQWLTAIHVTRADAHP